MKKQLLSVVVAMALIGSSFAQTTVYLDFEGATPTNGSFGGSTFEIVANPSATGINTSANVAMTAKTGNDPQTWGGTYFPCGGTINFAADAQTFSIDVYSSVTGVVTCKVEQGAQGAVEIQGNYTTANAWETVTFDMSTGTPGQLDPDYKQLVIFMGFTTTTDEVWYYDNVKGPGFTPGAAVDPTFSITDFSGTATSMAVAFSTDPLTKHAFEGTQGVGTIWSKSLTGIPGSTILAPVTYTIYVNDAAVVEFTDLDFAMAGSTGVNISKNYGSAPIDIELLTNPGFDDIEGPLVGRTSTEWGMWSDNGGVAEVIDGVVTVTPVTDADNWAMQVEQWNFAIENDKTYKVMFDAWADAERTICLTIEDPANGYATLGTSDDEGAYEIDGVTRSKWDIVITAEETTYEMYLTVDAMLESSTPKFAFLLAQSDEIVYIDNCSLKQFVDNVPSKQASSLNIYPNPASNLAYVNTKVGTMIQVYNITGKLMMSKVAANELETIDVANLASGIYMVKVAEKAVRLVVK